MGPRYLITLKNQVPSMTLLPMVCACAIGTARLEAFVHAPLGYTYDRLGTSNLLLPNAVVQNGILAPSGPAYRALILQNLTCIDLATAAKLHEFARSGLPIVLIGEIPKNEMSMARNTTKVVHSLMSLLLTWPGPVRSIEDPSDLVATLQEMQVYPRVSFSNDPSNVYTSWRADDSAGQEYMFLYNKGQDQTIELDVSVTNTSIPYILDTWTGEQIPLLTYQRTATGLSTEFQMKENQTRVVMFKRPEPASHLPISVTSMDKNIVNVKRANRTWIDIWATGRGSLTLSNGSNVQVDAPLARITNIKNWSLHIQSYHPTANISSTLNQISSRKIDRLGELVPWTSIPDLSNVSGIGIYTSSFCLDSLPSDYGTTISFGPVLNTLRAWINGHLVPPLDITDARADISAYVVQGHNVIKVEVTSNLFNAVKSRINSTSSAFVPANLTNPAGYNDRDFMDFGLIGPVVVESYTKISLLVAWL